MKKIKLYSEITYIIALVLLSFAVAMVSATDFGLSMIVAPAFILSNKIEILTFGQAEYIVQGLLFIIFCILMKNVKAVYFCSFITGVIYGAMLDFWRYVIPAFNPEVTAPGSMNFAVRCIYFGCSLILSTIAIALFFQSYIFPQVYEFFVKGISTKYHLDASKFKIIFDFTFLVISCCMAYFLFHKFVGVGIGTIIMTCFNGILIGFFGNLITKYIEIVPRFQSISNKFNLEGEL